MYRRDVIVRPGPECRLPPEAPEAPRLVEIGFGNGDFLVHLARRRPDAVVYGLEVSATCVEKALSRTLRAGVANLRLLCGDARFLLRECFDDGAVERVYMSFPCPWPKERHARRRVTAEGFSSTIAAVLQIGGVFELATDEAWYADEVQQVLGDHPALTLADRRLNHRREITTKYENKWLEMGKDIHHLYFRKQAPWTVRRLVTEGVEAMHLRLTPAVALSLEALADRVKGRCGQCQSGDDRGYWTFRQVYGNDGVVLVETICTDAGFEQKFYCKVVTKEEATLVKLDGVHLPYLTPAVRRALQDLAGAVAGHETMKR